MSKIEEIEEVAGIMNEFADKIFDETAIAVTGFVTTPKEQMMFTGPFSKEGAIGVMLTLMSGFDSCSKEDQATLKTIADKMKGPQK